MLDLIHRRFAGKSIVLLGFGREGQSTYTLLRKVFPDAELSIADQNDTVRNHPLLHLDKHLQFFTGAGYLEQITGFEVIIRSPGIPVWQLLTENETQNGKGRETRSKPGISRDQLTSQTELFLECYAKQVIGVTGTKGKSTTSTLIQHIFKTAGRDVLLAGNIGSPVFHFIDLIEPATTIVVELSSHQLEFLKVAPHISVLLNLYQEHLDAYESYQAYQLAKINISRYQQPHDFIIYNADDELVSEHLRPLLPNRQGFPFSLRNQLQPGGFVRDGLIFFADGERVVPVWKIHQDRFLKGEHNLRNIMAAVNAAMISGIEPELIEDGIATFKGLEHRLEYVGEFSGIHFYNDSIATIPEACMEAIKAIPMVDTLVAGGFDRGIDYNGLAKFLCDSSVRNFILVGEAGHRIMECMKPDIKQEQRFFYINRFDDFKPIAFHETRTGHACLLSPAAASYDEFRNFEERGKRFRELVSGKM
jgi:UDP-N-acetylmuramoylalanine--D-glutamate ligase